MLKQFRAGDANNNVIFVFTGLNLPATLTRSIHKTVQTLIIAFSNFLLAFIAFHPLRRSNFFRTFLFELIGLTRLNILAMFGLRGNELKTVFKVT